MFDSGGAARRWSQGRLLAATGLDTAFFVRRDDELTRIERAALPKAILQLEDAPGLGSEIWVTWKDPTAMSPRAKRIRAEPAPQARPANLSDQPGSDRTAPHVGVEEL
jgi:hypothetical protein